MAEPENVVLEHLRAIRGSIEPLERRVGQPEARVESKFEQVEERRDGIGTRMTGLTHAVMAGFGALVHRPDDHERRIARIEVERA
ncbi:hypothetical protein [Methylobacterium nonmethylotrophicum]|uniref:Uncharacterized protein n=1 Tax=Methylobacterium nonmethylotrophicum TaxID=1141884 RepID=A0A4Z0NXC4_9HYPH|nr:hypothetical protein [Methylobacterium nonmethylotrophicum]TGE01466.1 hypothetical protein EU555_05015 [Methylobacterium nonmethylotrophicum]